MKNRKLVLIFLMSFFIFFLYSIDETTDTIKKKNPQYYELSLNFGIEHDYLLIYDDYYYFYDDYSNIDDNEFHTKGFIHSQYISVFSFSFSFIYFPIPEFGIGFIHQVSSDILLWRLVYLSQFWPFLTNQVKIVNKFGSNKNKSWFLLEYGVWYNNNFNTFNHYLGPSILIGYEKTFGKEFNFVCGFTFKSSYKKYYYSSKDEYGKEIQGNEDYYFYFGIEFRWGFAFLYKIEEKK